MLCQNVTACHIMSRNVTSFGMACCNVSLRQGEAALFSTPSRMGLPGGGAGSGGVGRLSRVSTSLEGDVPLSPTVHASDAVDDEAKSDAVAFGADPQGLAELQSVPIQDFASRAQVCGCFVSVPPFIVIVSSRAFVRGAVQFHVRACVCA